VSRYADTPSSESDRGWSDDWSHLLRDVRHFGQRANSRIWFRGHADSRWALLPRLLREGGGPLEENILYWRFIELGGHLLPAEASAWDTLFIMQHFGVPTRLLDWSESFAVALHFALHEAESLGTEPVVFALAPYLLNDLTAGGGLHFPDTDFESYELFVKDLEKMDFSSFPHEVCAISGVRRLTRQQAQRGVFTLHRALESRLDAPGRFDTCVRRFVVPRSAFADARALNLAGIHEFSIYPDTEGLARYLRRTIFPREVS
jgi:hypothetical protein